MRFNPRAQSDGDTERRSGGGGGLGGGLGGGFPLPGGGGGRLTLGGVLIAGVFFLVAQFTGVDLSGVVGDGGTGTESSAGLVCTGEQANASANDDCSISLITTSVQDYWEKAFAEQVDGAYRPARSIVFSGTTRSACGTAQAAMGPFYCPNDERVYLDSDFMDDMLQGQLGAKGGPFALAYVIAHEYGHHVQNVLGYLGRARSQTGPQSDAVRIELMADCLGGMWAQGATETVDANGVPIIEELTQDDIARAVDAARAVGDDRIQQRSSGRVNPDAWTHGSAEQRVHWFNVGLKEGSLEACDTFAPGAL